MREELNGVSFLFWCHEAPPVAEREHSTWDLKTFKVHAEMDAGKIQYSAWAQLQGSQGK